MILMIKRKKMI